MGIMATCTGFAVWDTVVSDNSFRGVIVSSTMKDAIRTAKALGIKRPIMEPTFHRSWQAEAYREELRAAADAALFQFPEFREVLK